MLANRADSISILVTGSSTVGDACAVNPACDLDAQLDGLRNSGARILGFFPFGVSCGSASSCIAVGSTIAARTDRPGAERWNGRALRALPVLQPLSGQLNGVSCVTPGRCIAVGDTRRATLAELWSGKNWQVLPAQP